MCVSTQRGGIRGRTNDGTDGQRTDDDDGTDGQWTDDDDATDGRTENDDSDDGTDTTGRADGRKTTTVA